MLFSGFTRFYQKKRRIKQPQSRKYASDKITIPC
jgi:hypothetical protein